MEVKIQKLRPGAVTPRRGSADAAGYDLYACPADGQCVTIAPHVTAMIGTGLALAIPAGYFGGVFARSGLASKQGLRPANCVGVIDADYRGECTVALHNDTDEVRTVAPGDRIAQLVILPFLAAEFAEADALDETDRGAGGFGYDPIFLCAEEGCAGKTFGEASPEEKDAVSHRGRSLRLFVEKLENYLKDKGEKELC